MSETIGAVVAELSVDTSNAEGSISRINRQLKGYGMQVTKIRTEEQKLSTTRMQGYQAYADYLTRQAQAAEKVAASTRTMTAATEEATAATKTLDRTTESAGRHGVQSWMASSAAIRLLEGNVTNNIRAAERFVTQSKVLSGVLQTAFPVIGAVALLGVFGRLVDRIDEMNKKLKGMPEAIEALLNPKIVSGTLRNDQLQRSTDMINNHIAKLQGKPQNELAIQLDDARIAADKLQQSLLGDLELTKQLFKRDTLSMPERILASLKGMDISANPAINGMFLSYQQQLDRLGSKLSVDTHGGASLSDVASDRKAVEDKRRAYIQNINKEIAMRTGDVTISGALGRPEKMPYATIYGDQASTLTALRKMKEYQMTRLVTPMLQQAHDTSQGIEQGLPPRGRKGAAQAGPKTDKSVWYAKQVRKYDAYRDDLNAHVDSTSALGGEMVNTLAMRAAELRSKVLRASGSLWNAQSTGDDIAARNTGNLARANLRSRYSSGAIGEHELAVGAAGIHNTEFQAQQAALTEKLNAAKYNMPTDISGGRSVNEMSPEMLQNRVQRLKVQTDIQKLENEISELRGRHAATSVQDAAAVQRTQGFGGANNALMTFAQRATDASRALADFTMNTLRGLNQAIVGASMGQKGTFRQFGKSFEASGMNTMLQGAEGYGIKGVNSLLGSHFTNGKLGTAGNPMYVKLAEKAAAMGKSLLGDVPAAFHHLFGGGSATAAKSPTSRISAALNGAGSLNTSISSVSALLPYTSGMDGGSGSGSDTTGTKRGGINTGFLSGLGSMAGLMKSALSIGSILGFADGGIPPTNRPSIVGERGPELFLPGTSGRIIPNGALGGGGTTNIHIDARGTNAAMVHSSVAKAMQVTYGASSRTIPAQAADHARRRPR